MDIVNDYEHYLVYKYVLTVLHNNEHCMTCDKCKSSISLKLKECEDKRYRLNIESYNQNPFFLGYS